MKWKKEFFEHLDSAISISMGLRTWQGSPFEEKKPKHPIELVNDKYPDGWHCEVFDEVINDIKPHFNNIDFDYSKYRYCCYLGEHSYRYSNHHPLNKRISKSEYLQLTGREPLQRDCTEIKDEPTIKAEIAEITLKDFIKSLVGDLPDVSHYGGLDNPFQPMFIIEFYELNFNLGNVIKYILRDKGSDLQDLIKARDNINREIRKYEQDSNYIRHRKQKK